MRIDWKRASVVAGFGILIALLVAGTIVTRRRVAAQIADQQRGANARLVVMELERAESLLRDAESAQRAFLYTGDAKFLAPYERALDQIDPNIDALARSVAGDPSQQDSIGDLRNLSHSKLAELKQAIDLYQAGNRDDARAVVLSNRGTALMGHVREIIDTIESHEMAGSKGVSPSGRNFGATLWWIYIFSGTATACLILLAYSTLRGLSRHQPEPHALSSSNSTSTT